MPSRPPILNVCIVLGFILAGFGLLCNPLQIISSLMSPNEVEIPVWGQGSQTMSIPPLAYWTELVSSILDIFLALLLAACCAGALYLRPWARPAFFAFAALSFVIDTIGFAITGYAQLPVAAELASATAGQPLPQGMLIFAMLCMMICALPFYGAYPFFVVIALTRDRVRLAFELGYDPGGPPPQQAPMAAWPPPAEQQQSVPPQGYQYPSWYQGPQGPPPPPNPSPGDGEDDHSGHTPPPRQ